MHILGLFPGRGRNTSPESAITQRGNEFRDIDLGPPRRVRKKRVGHVQDGSGDTGHSFINFVAGQRPGPSAEAGGERREVPGPGPGHRLLVVDDNLDAALSLATLLRLQGHEVRVAYGGPDALGLLSSYRPEMILLDIGMPGMDGYEVARRLRQEPGLEDVVLAALTGWGLQEDRRRSAEAGFNHHLVKPPEPEALEKVLAELKRPETRG